jgi:hypothetical protein
MASKLPLLSTPVVDDQNPCYCPRQSVNDYLEELRKRRAPTARRSSFARAFDRHDHDHDLQDVLVNDYAGEWGQPLRYDALSDSIDPILPHHIPAGPTLRQRLLSRVPSATASTHYLQLLHPHARTNSDESSSGSSTINTCSSSDMSAHFSGSALNARSSMIVDDCSYELDGKATHISTFFPRHTGHSPSSDAADYEHAKNLPPAYLRDDAARIQKLERESSDVSVHILIQMEYHIDELYGPKIGPETLAAMSILISRLTTILPGIRLPERLHLLKPLDHQTIIDFLSNNG